MAVKNPYQHYPVHGPDVYEGNGDVDWAKLSKSGATFGIVKICEGTYEDKLATSARVNAMRRAGLYVGGYVFLRPKPGRSGADEMRRLYELGRGIGLWQRDRQTVRDVRPVLDCEATAFDTSTMRGRYRTRLYIRQAIRECVRLTGHKPIIYTGYYFWTDTIRCRWNLGCPLWLAAYPSKGIQENPDRLKIPTPWSRADLWQFTDKHRAPGITGPCDYNVFMGGDRGHSAFRQRLTF